MGLLPWSFGFLLILSILSWSAIGRMSEETLVTQSIVSSVQHQAAELTEKISSKSGVAYREYCAKTGNTPPEEEEEEEGENEDRDQAKKGKGSKAKQRRSSKLHIGALFSTDDGAQKQTQEKIFYNLLKVLYGGKPLFSSQGQDDTQVQQLFDEVRQKALEISPKMPMNKASLLANIELSGQKKGEKQFILFLILKGGEGELFRGRRCKVESLLPYISMNKRETCMSVYLAPLPILMALYENNDVVEKIIESRKAIYQKIKNEKEKSNAINLDEDKKNLIDTLSAEFKSQFEASLPSGIEPQFIDFRVSETYPKNNVVSRKY